MNVESQGVTIVTKGKEGAPRGTFKGPATTYLFSYLRDIVDKTEADGRPVEDHLSTEVSTSDKRADFTMVDLIDTPGLVDYENPDDMYAFDVNQVIYDLAQQSDMILVFFDPTGKALVRRTIEVVGKLSKDYQQHGKMHYFLSKADEAKGDYMEVHGQIIQALAPNIEGQHALKVHSIYLPDQEVAKFREESGETIATNYIEDLCEDIGKAVNLKVQDNLKQITVDCRLLEQDINQRVEMHEAHKAANFPIMLRGYLCLLLALMFQIMVVMAVGLMLVPDLAKPYVPRQLNLLAINQTALVVVQVIVVVCFIVYKLTPKFYKPTMTSAHHVVLKDLQADIGQLKTMQTKLYSDYMSKFVHFGSSH